MLLSNYVEILSLFAAIAPLDMSQGTHSSFRFLELPPF